MADYNTRPGRISDGLEDNPEAARSKQTNLERYTLQQSWGVPLFEGQNARGMRGAGFGMYDVGAFL